MALPGLSLPIDGAIFVMIFQRISKLNQHRLSLTNSEVNNNVWFISADMYHIQLSVSAFSFQLSAYRYQNEQSCLIDQAWLTSKEQLAECYPIEEFIQSEID